MHTARTMTTAGACGAAHAPTTKKNENHGGTGVLEGLPQNRARGASAWAPTARLVKSSSGLASAFCTAPEGTAGRPEPQHA